MHIKYKSNKIKKMRRKRVLTKQRLEYYFGRKARFRDFG